MIRERVLTRDQLAVLEGIALPWSDHTYITARRQQGEVRVEENLTADLEWLSLLLFQPSTGQPRVTVPFNPFFLAEVQSGQVKSISTRGDTIEGTLKAKVRYPAHDRSAKPTTLFKTEVPTFWNGAQLSALLKEKGVVINAKPTTTGTSLLAELLLGFGPTLLIVGLFILLARRAAQGGGMGALGNFGRSRDTVILPRLNT